MKSLLIATLAVFITATSAGAETILVKAKKVYTGTGEVLEPGAVLIVDGKVKAIGKTISGDGKVIEVDTVMPGMVDAYTQTGLGQTSERTREVTPDLKIAGMINWRSRSFKESLSSGTTTVHVAPGTDNVFAGLSSVVKSAGEKKTRVVSDSTGVLLSACADPARGNGARGRPESIYIRQPTNRMGVVWILRSTMHAALNGGKGVGMDVVRETMDGKRRVFAVSRTHYDTLALMDICKEFKMPVPMIVGGQEAWRITDELKEAKTGVVLGRLRPNSTRGTEQTRLCANLAGRLHKEGIPFCLSQGDLLEQARFAVRDGLDPKIALQAVTSAPAKMLGLEKRVGSLAEGMDADLVALSGDPLEFTTAVQWVMVDGVVQYKQAGN